MKLLIIGATGGLGKELVRQVLEQGRHLVALVRNPSAFAPEHNRTSLKFGATYPSRAPARYAP